MPEASAKIVSVKLTFPLLYYGRCMPAQPPAPCCNAAGKGQRSYPLKPHEWTWLFPQVDVAPEQQPAASSLASAASVHKLAEMAQSKAATELPASDALCSRSSTLAPASLAASSLSAFENAFSLAASEVAAATDATSGSRHLHMYLQLAAVPLPCCCFPPVQIILVAHALPAQLLGLCALAGFGMFRCTALTRSWAHILLAIYC